MDQLTKLKLLNDEAARREINKHLWIESEKAGRDIGYDNAASDWLIRFATDWIKNNKLEGKFSKATRRVTSTKSKS